MLNPSKIAKNSAKKGHFLGQNLAIKYHDGTKKGAKIPVFLCPK
jgi:hypothetical protein